MASPQPLINSGGNMFDANRAPACQPGQLVYCAKTDQEKLACFYKACCYCSTEDVVKRTFVDVYTNAVYMNTPVGCCCCCWTDRGQIHFFDNNRVFGEPIVGGCCSPFPYFCPHCFGCCGDTLVFKRGCGCPNGLGHCQGAMCGCICPIDIIFGLQEGEAANLQQQINGAVQRFRASGGKASSGQNML